ncbi:MAG: acetate--CoA ligase family protein [Candidatus Caldarchaeum sp.]
MNSLEAFFSPSSIAVVGVSRDPEKIGRVVYERLMANRESGVLRAEVYPVNPTVAEIMGRRVFASISDINESIDLVVVAVPASHVPQIISEAGRNNVRAAIIASGGFSETGNIHLTQLLKEIISSYRIRVLGPNTVGVIDNYTGVDTFFTRPLKPFSNGRPARSITYPRRGNIAIVSQSGAIAYYFIDSLGERGVGLRAAACVGNQVDVSLSELVGYFSNDALTAVIALYVEGVDDGRKFLNEVLKAVRAGKHVIVVKAGRTDIGRKAAYTHTTSMVGEWEAFVGALKQAGAVVVESVQELVDVAVALSLQKPPKGNRLAVLTNGGGFSVMSSDLAQATGLEIQPLPNHLAMELESLKKMEKIPAIVVPANPLDLSGSATPETFAEAYRVVSASGLYDMHLIMPFHFPPSMDETVIEKVAAIARNSGAMVVGCDTGSSEWAVAVRQLMVQNGIPSYRNMEEALKVLSTLAKVLKPARREFPIFKPQNGRGQRPLTRDEIYHMLRKYDVPVVKEKVVYSEDEVWDTAEEMGYPLVMKIGSQRLAHKTDVGGVVLGINSSQQAVQAFRKLSELAARLGVEKDGIAVQGMVYGLELILGSKIDPVFGPVTMVGLGGVFTEAIRDFVTFVAPLEYDEAGTMMDMLRFSNLFKGFRNIPPVDRKKLQKTITSFSKIVFENPSITVLEINPLIVAGDKITAVDARGMATLQ